jgi:hypothetical protein
VCTSAGRAGGEARSAARRPTTPAFAVCVCTTAGWRASMIRRSARQALKSRSGESARPSSGSRCSSRPAARASSARSPSPGAGVPVTSSVRQPRAASGAATRIAWRAGPPTLSRATTRSTSGMADRSWK